MIDRLCGENLLFVDLANGAIQVTERWIDAETERKQSSHPSVNKVYGECKQSLQPSVNKVTPNIEVEYEYKVKESVSEVKKNAPAKTEISTTLNTEEKTLSTGAGAALSPGWNDFPKADTPDQLKDELSRFYQARPQDWRMTKEATPAQNWNTTQTTAVVEKFCDWAVGEGWEKRTFKQINARLKRWFKEEPLRAATPGPKQRLQATPAQEPRGAAYQLIPADY